MMPRVCRETWDVVEIMEHSAAIKIACSAQGPNVMLTMYGPTNGLQVFQKEVGNSHRYLNPNYDQNLIPMESVPSLIALIWILGDETLKVWMSREEEK